MNEMEPTVADSEIRTVQEAWTRAFCPEPALATSPQDERRFIQAADRGDELRRLRAHCARHGFRPLPLDVYLAEACAEAGVALAGLWRTAAGHARDAWVALARMAQVPENALRVMVRAQFAVLPDGPRFRRDVSEDSVMPGPLLPDGASLEESVRLLDEWEATYPLERRRRLAITLDNLGR